MSPRVSCPPTWPDPTGIANGIRVSEPTAFFDTSWAMAVSPRLLFLI